MKQRKGGKQSKSDAQRKDNRCQSAILNRLVRARLLHPMFTGEDETVFQPPVLSEIVPPVILVFPPHMSQLPESLGVDGLRIQSGYPNPAMVSCDGL